MSKEKSAICTVNESIKLIRNTSFNLNHLKNFVLSWLLFSHIFNLIQKLYSKRGFHSYLLYAIMLVSFRK